MGQSCAGVRAPLQIARREAAAASLGRITGSLCAAARARVSLRDSLGSAACATVQFAAERVAVTEMFFAAYQGWSSKLRWPAATAGSVAMRAFASSIVPTVKM